jgi:hypothetical protein
MPTTSRLRIGFTTLLAAGALALVGSLASAALAASASSEAGKPSSSTVNVHKLLDSHELWATIDVCNGPQQANTVGIRGSMPGDGQAHDKMYMSFRLQYLNTTTSTWINLVSGATPSFEAVGAAGSARQDGASFQLVPVAGKPAATLRGVVDFQWRRGGKVLYSATRTTSAGHKSLAGAEPADYTAATCVIG